MQLREFTLVSPQLDAGQVFKAIGSQWKRLSKYWKVPKSASISEARQRVGPQVMRQLFERVVHPLATQQPLEPFWVDDE